MKTLFLITLLVFPFLTMAQKLNNKATDEKKSNEMLIGYCNRDGFKTINSNFDSAYKAEYPLYRTDAETMKQLAQKMKGIKITVVMATWCGDSKEWVPRFYKIMDEMNFKYKNLSLICVDRAKKAADTHVETLKVDLVPTFIFYRKRTEIGRIIEVPAGIFEKEILKIVSK